MTLFEKLLGHTLITADNIWGLMGVMCIGVALSIFLEQKYQWASKVSGAIIALIMAMVLANLGVIPTNSALYDDIVWGVIVPMAIPLLLLQALLAGVLGDAVRILGTALSADALLLGLDLVLLHPALQALGVLGRIVGLCDGHDDFFDSERLFRSISLDDLHGILSLGFARFSVLLRIFDPFRTISAVSRCAFF